MESTIENYLYKKYPKIFENHSKPMSETCMCWGCCHEKGWLKLLDKLCADITYYIKNQHNSVDYYLKSEQEKLNEDPNYKVKFPEWAKEKIPFVRFDQVKEKFGMLRIYYTGGDLKTSAMISFAESLSEHICETCGKFDITVGKTTEGWIHSICKSCNNEMDKSWKLLSSNKELESLLDRLEKLNTNTPKSKKIKSKKTRFFTKRCS